MSDFDSFLSSLSDEQKQKLMQALITPSDNEVPAKKELPKKKDKPSKPVANVGDDFVVNKEIQNSRRREVVRARKNEWTDNGEHRDIVTPEFEKTPRNRQAPKKVDLECDVCGRSFKEDSRFVYGERHRCSRCTGK
jgi:formylmethanofuran dehydrogenase subunit E